MDGSKAKTLGSFLKEVLDARGLTERMVAQGAGIAQSGLSNVISEKAREPDPNTLRRIAAFLKIDVFILFRLLGYVPPSTEAYGSYSPMGLYVAHRFDALPPERQRAVLHVIESLMEDREIQEEIKGVRENPNPSASLDNIEEALSERVNQCANWYLTNSRFQTAEEIDPKDDEEVYPGLLFGQLSTVFRARLIGLLRHKMRQIYSPDLVEMEYR